MRGAKNNESHMYCSPPGRKPVARRAQSATTRPGSAGKALYRPVIGGARPQGAGAVKTQLGRSQAARFHRRTFKCRSTPRHMPTARILRCDYSGSREQEYALMGDPDYPKPCDLALTSRTFSTTWHGATAGHRSRFRPNRGQIERHWHGRECFREECWKCTPRRPWEKRSAAATLT